MNAAEQSDSTDTAKIKSLNDEIDTLSQQLKAEQTSNFAASTRYDTIAQELSTTHHALSSSADELVPLRIKVGQLETNSRIRLSEETSILQNEIDQLKQQTATLSSHNQQLDDVASERGQEIANLKSSLKDIQRQLTAANDTQVSLENELVNAQTDLRQSREGVNDAQSQLVTLRQKDSHQQQQIARTETTSQLDSLVTDLGSTRGQLSRLKDENIMLKTRLDNSAKLSDQEMTSRLETATSELQAAERISASLQTELTQAQASLAAAQASNSANDTQTADIATQSAQIDAISASLAQEQTSRQSAEQQVASLTQDLVEVRNQLTQSETQISELGVTVPADNSAETIALQAEVSEALSNYAQLQEENESLKIDAASLTAQIEVLEEQLASDPAIVEPAEAPVADDNEKLALQAELSQTQSELNTARNDRDSLRSRLLALRTAPTRPGSPTAATLSRPTSPQPSRAATTSSPRTHTVVSGDTLSEISVQYYGTSRRWAEIYEANRAKLPNERALRIGMTILIP